MLDMLSHTSTDDYSTKAKYPFAKKINRSGNPLSGQTRGLKSPSLLQGAKLLRESNLAGYSYVIIYGDF